MRKRGKVSSPRLRVGLVFSSGQVLPGRQATVSSRLAQTAILGSLPLLGTRLGCYETTGRL